MQPSLVAMGLGYLRAAILKNNEFVDSVGLIKNVQNGGQQISSLSRDNLCQPKLKS
jgi:hypothetical protein